jgi:hypothetical protein
MVAFDRGHVLVIAEFVLVVSLVFDCLFVCCFDSCKSFLLCFKEYSLSSPKIEMIFLVLTYNTIKASFTIYELVKKKRTTWR